MRLTHTLLAVAVGGWLLASCTFLDHVKGSGPVVRKTLSVADFHGVELSGSLDVAITRGAVQQVEVEAQANIAELLELEVRDGICRISSRGSYTTNKPFVVHIVMPALDQVTVAGSGDVISTTPFEVDVLNVQLRGSGDVELNVVAGTVHADLSGSGEIKLLGTASTLDAQVKGSGDIKAGNLTTGSANARVVGSGDITVLTGTLDARITGSGDVKYKGAKPVITAQVTGSGEVRHVDE
ncbi:MAG: head GIN domain-containing protein [Flavobacteriales bacterium]|nr:head GIN domain-containing protein [Flavobacteriales bacterium]